LGIFAYLLLVQYDIGSILRLKNRIEDTEANLTTIKAASEYQTYINEFNSMYLNDENANWLIETITKFAESENVKIKLIKPITSGGISEYKVVRVLAEGRSEYLNLLSFIKRLENYNKHLFIEEFNINTNVSTNQQLMGPQQAFLPQFMGGAEEADGQGQVFEAEQSPAEEEGLSFKLIVSFFSK